jgi:hypothetical protein
MDASGERDQQNHANLKIASARDINTQLFPDEPTLIKYWIGQIRKRFLVRPQSKIFWKRDTGSQKVADLKGFRRDTAHSG